MTEKELKIKIRVDAKTGELKVVSGEFDKIGKSAKKTDDSITSLKTTLLGLGAAVGGVALIRKTFDEIIVKGVKLNSTIEDSTAGIAALISANTTGADDLTRFSTALADSAKIMEELKIASVDTAATFPELSSVFQQAIGPALGLGEAMGKSIDDISDKTIVLSQQFTNIAGSIGMPMEQVTEEIRSVMEGTVDVNSRIAKMLGITNQELKKAAKDMGGTFEYLEKKLKSFDALAQNMTFSKSIAKAKDAIDSFRIEATKPLVKDLTDEILDFTKIIKSNSDNWVKSFQDFYQNTTSQSGTILDLIKELGDSFLTLGDAIIDGFADVISNGADVLDLLGDKTKKTIGVFSWSMGILTGFFDLFKNGADFIKIAQLELSQWGDLLATGFKKSLESASLEWERAILGMYKTLDKLPFSDYTKEIEEQSQAVNEQTQEINKLTGSYNGRLAKGNLEILQLREGIKRYSDIEKHMQNVSKTSQEMFDLIEDKKPMAELMIGSKADITKTFNTLEKEHDKLLKQYSGNTKAIEKIDKEYYRAKNTLIKKATKLTTGELKLQTSKNKEALEEQKKEYQKFLEEKAKITEKFNNDYNKTFLKSYENEEIALQKQIAEYRKYVDNKLKVDELYQQKHLEILYKDQDKNLKLALEAYEAAGEKETALEIKKAIKKNEIVEKYSNILNKDQLAKAIELADKQIEQSQKTVDKIKTIWEELGDSLSNNFSKAFDDILFNGASFSKTFSEMFTGIFQESSKGLMQLLANDFSSGDILSKAQNLITGGYGSFTGGIDALAGNSLGINNWLGANLSTSIGGVAGAGAIGYGAGSLLDSFRGTDSQAANYGAIGAAAGSIIPGIGTAVGAAVGTVLGAFNAKWETKYGGVSLDGHGGVQSFEKQEKNKLFGFADKDRIVYNDASNEVVAYFDSVYASIEKINNVFNKHAKFDFSGKIKANELSETISKELLKAINPAEIESKTIGSGISNLGERIAQAAKISIATAINQIEINDMYEVWEAYAKKINIATETAISSAVDKLDTDKKQFESFFDGYFDMKNPFQKLKENFIESYNDFTDLASEIDGAAGVNLSNFEELRTAMTRGANFTPENLENWSKLQYSLENAATGARTFSEALEGLIGKYDKAIQSFDQVIADFQGIQLQKAEDSAMTIAAIEKLANAVLSEKDHDKQLQLSADFLTAIQKLNEDQDARFQAVVEGSTVDTEALMLEFNQTLSAGLEGLANEITATNQGIIDAQKVGDTDAVERLNEQLEILQSQQAKLEDIAVKGDNEGLSAEIAADFQEVNDLAFAHMATTVKEGLVESKLGLEELVAQTNEYLAAIEGQLALPDQGLIDLNTNLVNWNTDQTTATANIQASLEMIPSSISTSMESALLPTNTYMESMQTGISTLGTNISAMPEAIGTNMVTAIEPVTVAVTQLPEMFESSLGTTMAPISTSLTELPANIEATMQTLSAEFTTSLTQGFQSNTESLQNVSTQLQTLSGDISASFQDLSNNINTALENGLQPINNIMTEMVTITTQLPAQMDASFSTTLTPVVVALGDVTAGLDTLDENIGASIAKEIYPLQTAMDSNTTAVRELQNYEARSASATENIVGSIYDVGGQIANAVGGAISGAIEAANRAAGYAGDAAQSANRAANTVGSINNRLGSIEANTRQTVVQTAVVAQNTGA